MLPLIDGIVQKYTSFNSVYELRWPLYLTSLAFTFMCNIIHFATRRWGATWGIEEFTPTTEAGKKIMH
jgi:hypothetical protein